ncbi:unnamed protein product [Musa hybrid cultivar]
MIIYMALGDELLSDSFPFKEIKNRLITWVVEGGEEDESVDDSIVKVVDIVDTFRLQEQPSFNKKQFVTYMKHYIKLWMPKLEAEKQELFKNHIKQATKILLSMLSDLQFFVGESLHDNGSMVFAYYKEGATDPTFLCLAVGLKEVKC